MPRSVTDRLRRTILAAIVLALALAGAARADVPAAKYRLHFEGTGSEKFDTVAQPDEGNGLQPDAHEKGDWTFKPDDVEVWLPKTASGINADPLVTETTTQDPAAAPGQPVGHVSTTGDFETQCGDHDCLKPYSCKGGIDAFGAGIIQRVAQGQLSRDVALETDLKDLYEGFDPAAGPVPTTGAGTYPCTPDDFPGVEPWQYEWTDGPPQVRLQLGALIPAQEVGEPFIAMPAQDFSNVLTAEPRCPNDDDATCEYSFGLSGEYDLTKICDGAVGASGGTCGGGTQTPPPTKPPPTPPPPPGGSGGGAVTPKVTTGAAEATGRHTVRLHGTVNPEGVAASYHFEYGASKHYGSNTPVETLAAGHAAKAVTATVHGLKRGKRLHVRLVASNATGGSADGADARFTAPPLKPRKVTLAAHFARAKKHPRRFKVSGGVKRPPGVAASGCGGKVRLVLERRHRTLTTAKAKVHGDCAYKTVVDLGADGLGTHGTLTVKGRFTGHGALSARSAKPARAAYHL